MKFERYLPGDFIMFCGPFRNGKTSGAVRLAYHLWRRGYAVVSNIPLLFSSRLITTIDEVLELRNVVFLWDEIQATLDSRNFSGPLQIKVTQESIYFGKRGNILIMTTPDLILVDIRYRTYTHHVYNVRKIYQGGQYWAINEYCWYNATREMLLPRGKFKQSLLRYAGLFDTFYEKVILNPASDSEYIKAAARRKRADADKIKVVDKALW